MLVLTRDEAIPLLGRIVCVPLTTTVRGTPAEMSFDEDDGLPRSCVANFDDVRVIDRSLLVERAARLAPERHAELCETLAIALGC